MTLLKLYKIAAEQDIVVNDLFHMSTTPYLYAATVSRQFEEFRSDVVAWGYAQGTTPAMALERAMVVSICRAVDNKVRFCKPGIDYEHPHKLTLEQVL